MASSSPTGMILLIDVDWQKSCTTFRCIRNLVNHLRFSMVLHINWCTTFCLPTVWDKSSLDILTTQTLDAGERAVPQRSGAPNKHETRQTSTASVSDQNSRTERLRLMEVPTIKKYQVIQAVTFLSPIVGGHQQPLKGSLNHPKEVTKSLVYIHYRQLHLEGF